MQQLNVIGLMSGSSLDGVDLCYAEFYYENGQWRYQGCVSETVLYSEKWKLQLQNVAQENAFNFSEINVRYGYYLGTLVNEFILKNALEVDLIASHGHTVFHQPQHKFSVQIGDGATLYAVTGIKTVSDFRSVDIALGGQGAPLVPVGERDLFEAYGLFLNLGGIANISIFDQKKSVLAYDIAPCNLPLNILCEKYFNVAYDANGAIALRGKLDQKLLSELRQLPYFSIIPPKSLGREFIEEEYLPIVEKASLSKEDKLYTILFHITDEISDAINKVAPLSRQASVLVTGGGVHNGFLMDLLKQKCKIELTVPDSEIVNFKEALIFAYLGVLRFTNSTNALASVTNASKNSIGGALWG